MSFSIPWRLAAKFLWLQVWHANTQKWVKGSMKTLVWLRWWSWQWWNVSHSSCISTWSIYLYLYKHNRWSSRPKVCSNSFLDLPGASTFTCANTIGDQLGQRCAVIVSCSCTSTFTFTNTIGDQLGQRCAVIVSWFYLEHLPLPVQTQ